MCILQVLREKEGSYVVLMQCRVAVKQDKQKRRKKHHQNKQVHNKSDHWISVDCNLGMITCSVDGQIKFPTGVGHDDRHDEIAKQFDIATVRKVYVVYELRT